MTLTPDQVARAADLIRRTNAHERAIANLGRMIEAATIMATANANARDALTNVAADPNRLGELIPLIRRADPDTAAMARLRYELFLADLIHPAMGGPPRKLDHHTLAAASRPYVLAPFLGLAVAGVYPRLCLATSQPPHRLTYLITAGVSDPATWRARLPEIGAYLGDTWAVASHTATSITLVRQDPLPVSIPMAPRYLATGNLFLGIDVAARSPVHVPLRSMSAGTLVVGRAGSGKSNATHVLLQSLFANLDLFQTVLLIDGKEGHTFARYRGRPKVKVLIDETAVWQAIAELVPIMRARNAALADAGLETAPHSFIAVIIEEMSHYTTKPISDDKAEAKRHAQFLTDLATLLRRGRSAGIKCLITAQDPTDDQVPTKVRSNCQTIIAFKQLVNHATMLMGELTPENDPRHLPTGQAIVRHDSGAIQTVQFPLPVTPGGTA